MVRRKVTRRRTAAKYIVTVKQTLKSVPLTKTMADSLKSRVKKRSPGASITMRKV